MASKVNSVTCAKPSAGARAHFETGYDWEVLACSLHRVLRIWFICWVGPLPITRA